MKTVTVEPGRADSVRLDDIPEPDPQEGAVLVETIAVGACSTDREIVGGLYGAAPPGRNRLVLGHESLGRVSSAPAKSGLHAGDHVVGIVRQPDDWAAWLSPDVKRTGLLALGVADGDEHEIPALPYLPIPLPSGVERRVQSASLAIARVGHYRGAASGGRALRKAVGLLMEAIPPAS